MRTLDTCVRGWCPGRKSAPRFLDELDGRIRRRHRAVRARYDRDTRGDRGGARGGLVGERVEVLDLRADEGDAVVGAAVQREGERGGERGEKVRESDPWRAVLRKVAVAVICAAAAYAWANSGDSERKP